MHMGRCDLARGPTVVVLPPCFFGGPFNLCDGTVTFTSAPTVEFIASGHFQISNPKHLRSKDFLFSFLWLETYKKLHSFLDAFLKIIIK